MRQFRERIRNPDQVNEDNVLDGEIAGGNDENQDNNNNQAVIDNNETEDASEEPAEVPAAAPPSLWMVFSNTIYMFFASLFPENIQVN